MNTEIAAQSSTLPPLSPILEKQVQIEKQVGELYLLFAHAFHSNPELRAFWSSMALEEGGHAALLQALNNGALSGVIQVMPVTIPVNVVESLAVRVAEYLQRAQQETLQISIDTALQMAWEIETSELDILRELVVSASKPRPNRLSDLNAGKRYAAHGSAQKNDPKVCDG